jgi:hypothetical protein
MVVRAAAVGTPVWSALGLGEWEMGGGDECGEEGQAPRPFIGSEGGAGRPDGRRRGSGSRWWQHQCRSSDSVERGNRG